MLIILLKSLLLTHFLNKSGAGNILWKFRYFRVLYSFLIYGKLWKFTATIPTYTRKWQPVAVPEMYSYIAILIYVGIHVGNIESATRIVILLGQFIRRYLKLCHSTVSRIFTPGLSSPRNEQPDYFSTSKVPSYLFLVYKYLQSLDRASNSDIQAATALLRIPGRSYAIDGSNLGDRGSKNSGERRILNVENRFPFLNISK